MSQVVVAVEGAVAIVRGTVARPQAADREAHRLVAPAGLLLQTARAHHRDVEDAHPQAAARGPHHVDQDVRPLHDAGEETVDGTSHGPLATTAEGYLGINLDLLPPKRKRAHQHPGCQGHDPAHRRAAAAQDQAVHGL